MRILLLTNDQDIENKVKKYYKEHYEHIHIDCVNQNVHIYDLKHDYIILIIDIDSLDFSGVVTVDFLKRRYKRSVMTYLSHNEYNEYLYPDPPFFYLLKKHLYTDLYRLMYFYYGLDQEILRFKSKTRKYNRVKVFYDYFNIKDVMYIESKQKESIVHKEDGDTIVYMPIGRIEEQLTYDNKDNFIRIHKCFMINTHFIYQYKNYRVYLNESFSIPVGVKYRKLLKERLFYLATNNE